MKAILKIIQDFILQSLKMIVHLKIKCIQTRLSLKQN